MNDMSFLKEIEKESGERISACYQCYRCTNSCPVLSDMDILPHRVIRYVVLGDKEKVLASKTIWSCLQCYTCSVRCPNDIHVGHVFDTLRKVAIREKKAGSPDVWKFDELFLDSVASTAASMSSRPSCATRWARWKSKGPWMMRRWASTW